MSEISFLCGLGNPGARYENTRHNLGFDVVDLIASRSGLKWKRCGENSLRASWKSSGRTVILIKPQTYMNCSGDALSDIKGLSPSSLLVICDDISLPLGRLRIRAAGGSGGHNGLLSITQYLGTSEFARLRMGCGPTPEGDEWSDYVLSPFSPDDRPSADAMTRAAIKAVEMILSRGIAATQMEFNRPEK
ncbi:MAG: aminoacyl-tRNA hydrolase [Candidatus Krumholzibacteria bacterium]|nr:aminoacyl-tRNA hydrolase [Candidatus Krumholzibacteria bacterium]